jgi:DHA2 family multidrug resistance protein
MMMHFNLEVPQHLIITSGVVQGLGLGLVFVPVSTVAYTTLPMRARAEAAGLFSLMRNIGSSVGISLVFTLLARNTQINHAEIASRITPYSGLPLPPGFDPSNAASLAALNAEVTRQAAAIAYVDDFWLMMWLTLAALPLRALLRRSRTVVTAAAPPPSADH